MPKIRNIRYLANLVGQELRITKCSYRKWGKTSFQKYGKIYVNSNENSKKTKKKEKRLERYLKTIQFDKKELILK